MEKYYDIPKENSLGSMEGTEDISSLDSHSTIKNFEISPEVEKMVMEKVKDIFEYGQAITGFGELGISNWRGGLEFLKDRSNYSFTPLSPLSIREYFLSKRRSSTTIEGIFNFGVQSLMDKNARIIAKNSSEYREKIRKTEEILEDPDGLGIFGITIEEGVFFNINGRDVNMYTEVEAPYFKEIALLFELPKETFIIDQESDKTKEVFSKEYVDIEGESDHVKIVKKRLKAGEFSVRPDGWVQYGVANFFKNNPDLKIKDKRILEEIEKRKETGKPYNYTDFNEKGDVITGSGEGYMTPRRIAPRKFQGLVVGSKKPKEVLYEDVTHDDKIDLSDEELYNRTVAFFNKLHSGDEKSISNHNKNLSQKIIETMLLACKDHPNYLIPIYDCYGNLLWPQKISHEEIVKMKEKSDQK